MRAALDSKYENVILSAEDLFFLDEPEIRPFAGIVYDLFDNIVIVAYLRRQDELAASHKAQGAKTIQSAWVFGFEADPLPALNSQVIGYLDFDSKLAAWASAFPNAQLRVHEYRRDRLVNGDIVADFAEILNIDLCHTQDDVNAALGANQIKLIYNLRQRGVGQRFVKRIHRDGVLTADHHKFLPTHNQAREFYAAFKNSNQALEERLQGFEFHDDFSRYPDVLVNTGFGEYERENLYRILSSISKTNPEDLARRLIELEGRVRKRSLFAMLKPEILGADLADELISIASDLDPRAHDVERAKRKAKARHSGFLSRIKTKVQHIKARWS
ncbi:hypothetical protein [Sinisalibacter aestuarii]|uniref:Uncharacterized protein n=1 Tax=Sinisalibacter aestuarii TaxID=2949426 RepID=A0ABQ5LSW9_9RHOB|nr:hypothetical protein [Sinisalibacter aestuarii]GKY88062.1 hypothetical protein STA1M1_19310 [Sinisalibacter aestuarii]